MTTLKIKSGAGGTWEEVGGVGIGVPAGGTTGQVLTKTSAADYATAWATLAAQSADGQCRLDYVSSTQIRLAPYAGDLLIINGTPRTLPAGGISLSNAGLPDASTVFIYAFWTGSALALEGGVTAPVESSPGYWVKGGDPTRRVVGIARTGGTSPGNQFISSPQYRAVRSLFHPRAVSLASQITGAVTQAWPTAGVARAELQLGWLAADVPECVEVTVSASALAASGTYLWLKLSLDGTAPVSDLSTFIIASVGDCALTLTGVFDAAPWSYHTVDPLIAGDGTTSMTVNARTRMWGRCRT